MALIVEDGTGKEDSESYITVADADTYHANRGNADWAELTEPEKESALRKGFDYLLQVYRQRWAGIRTKSIQAGDWPRAYVPRDDGLNENLYLDHLPTSLDYYYPSNFIPRELKFANAELGLLSTTEELTLETERITTSEQVGSIKVTYDRGAADKRRFPMVEGYLRPFLKAGGAGVIARG